MRSRLLTVREQVIIAGLAVSIVMGALVVYWRDRAPALLPITSERFGAATVPTAALPPPAPPRHLAPAPRDAALSIPVEAEPLPAEPDRVGVAAMGGVRREGLYYLDAHSRVSDLLDAAGGPGADADLSDTNLSAPLIDGSTLTVPQSRVRNREGSALTMVPSSSAVAFNPAAYTLSGTGIGAASPEQTGAQSSSSAAAGGRINLNTADAAALESLPGIGPALAARIIAYRGQVSFQTVDDLANVSGIGPKRLEAIRSLVTVQ